MNEPTDNQTTMRVILIAERAAWGALVLGLIYGAALICIKTPDPVPGGHLRPASVAEELMLLVPAL